MLKWPFHSRMCWSLSVRIRLRDARARKLRCSRPTNRTVRSSACYSIYWLCQFTIRSNTVFIACMRESNPQLTPSDPPAGSQLHSPSPPCHKESLMYGQAKAPQLRALHWCWRLYSLESQNISNRNIGFGCFICIFLATLMKLNLIKKIAVRLQTDFRSSPPKWYSQGCCVHH